MSSRVSVIIPTKDRPGLTRRAVDSVVAQTFVDWDLIVVDDGSTVDPVEGRSDFGDEPRVLIASRPQDLPCGAASCRNFGAELARSDLLVFLDSDDVMLSHCLGQRVNAFDAEPTLDAVICASVSEGHGTKKIGSPGNELLKFLSLGWPWQTTGPTWRREFFESIGGWDASLPVGQDTDLGLRALVAGCSFRWLHDGDHVIFNTPNSLGTRAFTLEGCGVFEARSRWLLDVYGSHDDSTFRYAALGHLLWVCQRYADLGEAEHARQLWAEAAASCHMCRRIAFGGKAAISVTRYRLAAILAPIVLGLLPKGLLPVYGSRLSETNATTWTLPHSLQQAPADRVRYWYDAAGYAKALARLLIKRVKLLHSVEQSLRGSTRHVQPCR